MQTCSCRHDSWCGRSLNHVESTLILVFNDAKAFGVVVQILLQMQQLFRTTLLYSKAAPAYRAPESFQNSVAKKEYTKQFDIWSLGCMF